MAKKQSTKARRRVPKTVLRLPDMDQAKSAVLNSLSSIDAQRGYRHAIEEFIEWFCSGASALVQPDRRPSLPHPPGVSASGARHRQSPSGRGAPPGLRGVRLRTAEPRLGGGDTTRQGS